MAGIEPAFRVAHELNLAPWTYKDYYLRLWVRKPKNTAFKIYCASPSAPHCTENESGEELRYPLKLTALQPVRFIFCASSKKSALLPTERRYTRNLR